MLMQSKKAFRKFVAPPQAVIPPAPKAKKERRGAQRIRTVFRIAKVARDRVVGLWRVRNISDRGMMLRTHVPVSAGEHLSIALSDTVALDGKVVWQEGDCCGVEFEKPIDSTKVLQALCDEQHAAHHRPPRLKVDMHAVAYCDRGIQGIHITDISLHGLGFAHDGCFKSGMNTLITLESGLERRGVVRWSDGERAGVQLVEPFTCDELESAGLA